MRHVKASFVDRRRVILQTFTFEVILFETLSNECILALLYIGRVIVFHLSTNIEFINDELPGMKIFRINKRIQYLIIRNIKIIHIITRLYYTPKTVIKNEILFTRFLHMQFTIKIRLKLCQINLLLIERSSKI